MSINIKKDVSANMKQYIEFLQHHHGYTLQQMWDYKNPFTKKSGELKKYLEKVI
jgi:hypothetical protein